MYWQPHQCREQVNRKSCIYIHTYTDIYIFVGFPSGTVVKNMPANAGHMDSMPGSGRSPGVGNSNPLLILLPGKFHGQRSLAG